MRICLLCRDPDLSLLCRKVLEGYLPAPVEFVSRAEDATGAIAELYVVECQAADDVPVNFRLEELRRTVLIVGREDLPAVRSRLSFFPVPTVVKPANRAGIEAAVKSLIDGSGHRHAHDALHAERDDIFQYLLRASHRLEEYDRERANFVGRATHELQGPLTSLNGYCGLLLDGQLGALSSEQREVIERMRSSVGRASRLTSAMFQLGVNRFSEYKPNFQRGELLACVERAMDEVASLCQERRISVDVQLSPAGSNLYFERQQLEQVFMNLLDNSCKYAPRGGQIQVRGYPFFWERRASAESHNAGPLDRRRASSPLANSYRIDIIDNGPGISPDRLETLFEEYAGYSNATDRSGTGLGLAVCKLVLLRHGGRIWAESEGNGAKFSLVMPYGVPESEDVRQFHSQHNDMHFRGTT